MERLKKIGHVRPKKPFETGDSRIGIGFEKLDRAIFDPEKAYDKVAALGVKWVRLQSGWQRTETVRGVYDFSWLDDIVDNLIRRGMTPWICLCYGNKLYNKEAERMFGAVGCAPTRNDDQKKGWANYVTALTKHYKGRVSWYEIWNEPDWCWRDENLELKASGTEYGLFAVDTAKAVKAGDPDAHIIGGCVSDKDLFFTYHVLEAGMAPYVDALSFHEYTPDESDVPVKVAYLKSLCHRYNPAIRIIQGESGSQSRSDGAGAMAGGAWTPEKQAKQCVRHTVTDLMTDVLFPSFFTAVDMVEALYGTVGNVASYLDYGYFGVLGADFDENGHSVGTYTEKPAYYALQTLCSVFGGKFDNVPLPVKFMTLPSVRTLANDMPAGEVVYGGFRRGDACALAYWRRTELMTTSFEGTVSLNVAIPGRIRLIDLKCGDVYDVPESLVERREGDCILLKNLPVRDSPLLLTVGDFADVADL